MDTDPGRGDKLKTDSFKETLVFADLAAVIGCQQ
jgi:hypothetical protein